ncbi:tenecin-1-like [Diabrotica virgifera virgifera]|uniref:Invertebrate defensins family profile domain-containing protein n=1 Tax=Diabrotica virgifera virgifera TaxID=50390 RepID=A0ABM5IUI2_DIAVI|nr:tenecin-1-like [Diabrotica virgifera virgifera]
MKNIIVSFFVICLIASVFASPARISFKDVDQHVKNQQGHGRFKRFSCDVLSIEAKGVALNDSPCALHCLSLGKRGGWCNDQKVCNCR